jgi:transposase
MPAVYVKPYAKRGKSGAIDAEAICEAVSRPTMRVVPAKSVEQQSIAMLHRTGTCWFGSGPCWSTRCGGIWQNSA